jgi:Tannase-like family of unknown function (DUF6351)
VLSNRADLISAGDALVAVRAPRSVDPSTIRVSVDGRDVTQRFATRPNGRVEGLLTGLKRGTSMLRARAPSVNGAEIAITNHRSGGPVFSGPQIKPWRCQPTARDAQCNQPPSYEYIYKSSTTGLLQEYDRRFAST